MELIHYYLLGNLVSSLTESLMLKGMSITKMGDCLVFFSVLQIPARTLKMC